MRLPYTQLYLHCVWSTYKHLPLISPHVETALYAAITTKCRELHCHVLAVGGDVDHIHLFVRFPPTLAVATLIKEVKEATEHLMSQGANPDEIDRWQARYGAYTVTKRSADTVIEYIRKQKTYHANQRLIDEFELCEQVDNHV